MPPVGVELVLAPNILDVLGSGALGSFGVVWIVQLPERCLGAG